MGKNIIESDLKNLNNFYGGNLIMKLFCCELNTTFDLKRLEVTPFIIIIT